MSGEAGPRRLDFRADPWDDALLGAVVEHLRAGGLVTYPTETVYGFGGRAAPEPVEAVLALKGRGPKKPLLLLVSDVESVEDLGWTDEARTLADVFWPGALTLVLADPDRRFPPGVRSPDGGVAVRRTPHPLARALVERLGEPLTSTSANRSGEEPARRGDEAWSLLRGLGCGDEMWLLDGGPLPPSEPSTIVDCTGPELRVLREGAVLVSRLRCAGPEIA